MLLVGGVFAAKGGWATVLLPDITEDDQAVVNKTPRSTT